MAPKRRSAGTASTAVPSNRNQSTLSFNNKARVTKQSHTTLPPSSDKAKSVVSSRLGSEIVDQTSDTETPKVAEIKPDSLSATENNGGSHLQMPDGGEKAEAKAEVADGGDEPRHHSTTRPRRRTKTDAGYNAKVKQAEKLSDAKIKAYWKAEEDSRLAPRVHQKDIHIHEKILRHFDLSSQYGPCIGIPRLDRWKRASNLGMDPPVEVLAVLLKEENKGTDKGVGARQCGRLAYIDELAAGRVVLVE